MKEDNQQAKVLLSVVEAAHTLGLSRSNMYRIIHSREGPRVARLGKRIYIPAGELQHWLDKQINYLNGGK